MIHTINIHSVANINVGATSRNEISNDYYQDYRRVYFTREIVFTDKLGNKVTINVFGESEADIELK